ncbi:recombinase family protein [Mesorhizobium sp. M7A.F.Ca.MR.148.00.0.0]|uniref:recombinase family protein n=1 Tax=Mesorhizobium sp. M7A.F.Ca.MR.148.00.0.0 TaxID=2496775 RepID=UPI000FCC309A|nr:recombinase family protein [Mesorhizobium sp. M7A.F.Ca.MR.148.00.0.0]RUV33150.1 recombinase family protein [Mesorhizobium sp. M7A.F.Ca.MR.148.00.0.0]
MFVGYARTSTVEQQAGYEAQLRDLKSQGCDKVFREQVSSVNSHRPELERAIEFVRENDVLVVTRLDRLARSVGDLQQIVGRLEAKKVGLKILDMAIDTSSATGRLLMNLVGSIAQFEREIMLARQREGIAKAKAEKKFLGRAPTARRKTSSVVSMHGAGKKPTDIAKELGIGRSSVYRILADAA